MKPAGNSLLHKISDAISGTYAFLFFTAPIWMAAAGIGAGILLAPVLGVGAIAAGVAGGLAGFLGGASGYLAIGRESNKRCWPVPANIILGPLASLEGKIYTKALAQEISAVDKKRLSDAYSKVAAPTREAKKLLASGELFAKVALTVRNRQGTIDSSVKAIEARAYPLATTLYKP